MIIVIDEQKEVRLLNPLDNKRFHVEIRCNDADLATVSAAFLPYGELTSSEHALVHTAALRNWPGAAGDPRYHSGLDTMLEYAALKGWLSPDGKRVQVHVVWREAPDVRANPSERATE